MSKLSIGWTVQEGTGDERKAIRTFENVPVNIFGTLKETVEFYGEDFVLESLNGTSIVVQIQQHMRMRSKAKKADSAEWLYTDAELTKYAGTYKPDVSIRSSMYDDASPEVLKARAIVRAFEKSQRAKKDETSGTLVKGRNQ